MNANFRFAECRRSPTQVKKVIALFFIDVLLRRGKSDLCYRRRIRSFSAPYSASAHLFINANFKFAEWCRSQDYFSLNYAKEENLLLVIGASPVHCQRHIQLQGNSDFMSSERRCTMQNKKAMCFVYLAAVTKQNLFFVVRLRSPVSTPYSAAVKRIDGFSFVSFAFL